MLETITQELREILEQTPELHQAYLVGGCVRDWLLGFPVKDYDIEVFGISYEQLVAALARWGRTDLVGRSFGVVKLNTRSGAFYDFTIPRRDSKVAAGHKGFSITFDPSLQPRDAAARRDFTVNSLMFDPRQSKVLDFFGGEADLRNRVLRHTSEAFVEDPLRVLRGMQFASRFELSAAPETVQLCKSIKASLPELAPERVREEWFKWASKSKKPSLGLKFLMETEWVDHFPEIKALQATPQDPEWHPEGDVFVHTCHCCDMLVTLPGWQTADEESRIVYALATLAHDFGKPKTTQRALREGKERIISPAHEELGVEVAEAFLKRINAPNSVIERIPPLIRNHMSHLLPITDRSVRRLAKRLEPENIHGLALLMTADSMGRPPRPAVVPQFVKDLEAKAGELNVQASAAKPILMGRHLLELGLRAGPQFKQILNSAYEAQLEGAFFSLPGAFQWLTTQEMDLPEAVLERLKDQGRISRIE
ncbi:MAG TPA: HD domain-containing protein [Candidatus Saccharimonadales bacterium]|nr:HD domain-containing protein [Candidatus Saccharimonadales bacterium]